jgi:hypothetical protein
MRQLALALLIVHLAACSSMQTVAIRDVQAGGENSPIFPGDRVEVITRDNEKLEFPVTDITGEGISGQFGFIRYDDIRTLSVRKPGTDGDEATKWILGALAAAAVVALVAASDSVTVCSGSPCPNDPD